MARVFGPDQQYRVFYHTTGPRAGELVRPGTAVPLYADSGGNTSADVLDENSNPIAGSPPTLEIGSTYELPGFWYPDGVKVVYTRIGDDGPIIPLYAQAAARLAELEAADHLTHPSAPAYNAMPVNLGKWRSAVAAMRRGAGQVKILCVGDSTTIGYGSSVQGSYPSWLPRLLNAPAVAGFSVARHPATPDSRWTLGSGWNFSNGLGFGRATAYVATTAASGALTFNPGIEFDTVDVYFAADPGNGTSVVTINGSTTNLVSGLTTGFRKQTITRTAGRHTVSIAPPTGGQMIIFGIDAYLSTASQIRVGNAGALGTSTQEWAYVDDAWNSIAGLDTYDPDLTIFMLGINDASVPVSLEEFRENIETFGDVAEVYGSFLLMSTIPSQDAEVAALEADYRDVMRELSAERGWPMVDIYERFGSYVIADGLGFMSDDIHGSATGYADIAAAVAAVLNSSLQVETDAGVGTWTSYTPEFGGGGWAVGNGQVVGRYVQIGKIVHWIAEVTMGSTSTYGAGPMVITLPIAKTSALSGFQLTVQGLDSGNNVFLLFGSYLSPTEIAIYGQAASGSAVIGSTAPFAWSSGDALYISGTYEAA